MRVCLTHMRHAMSGGTELYLNYLATYLCDRGHDVTIVCRSHGKTPHPRVRFVVLRDFALVKSWRVWAFARSVERHIRLTPYDVVLGLGKTWSQNVIRLGGGTHAAFLESMKNHTPGRKWVRFKDRVALDIEQRAFTSPECRAVVAISDMVRRDVIDRYRLPPDRVKLIYNGVDLKRFHPGYRTNHGLAVREAAGFGAEHLVFLFLGTGYKRKGLDLLLEAFPLVLAGCPSARLLVVGRDSSVSAYQALARNHGIAHVVRFLGERTDTGACYGAADVYVLPTRYDPFGFTVLEALACGLPVVTTTTCGAGELLENETQGSRVDLHRESREGLASVMLSWCNLDRLNKARVATRDLAEKYDINAGLAEMESILLDQSR